ncbi:MAG: hypothetical protein KBG40_08070 [Bacteroidales bacterium]|nr:hypothetical protein [Bacteroidales bacterium]
MDFLRNIRLKIGRNILRRKMKHAKRTKFKGNLKTARTMGMVWDASDVLNFHVLSQFQQKMQEKNINLTIIAFYPGKILPDTLTAIRYLICLKNNDLNFFYIPVSKEAEKFIKTPFDILIDVNFNKIFPLEYIVMLSEAGLKVGVYDENNSNPPYDLMIDAVKPLNIKDYLENSIQYLEMINTKTESAN